MRALSSQDIVRGLLRLAVAMALWAASLEPWSELRGQVSREYDVKAVFLFNFAQFVDWPAEAFPLPETPLVIGVLGVDPFNRALDEVVKNESIRGRRVKPERFKTVEEIGLCHVLFISASEAPSLPRTLEALKNRPILTVSDAEEFLRCGGMIQFYTEDAKVRLRISNEATRAARLSVSSKLLRVADVVTTRSPD